MKSISRVKVLNLEGSPRERGQVYGETLKPMILQAIEAWKANLRKAVGTDPDHYIERFLAEADLVAAVRTWTPHLLDEVNGIGEGAGVDFNSIFAYQCPDEEWWYRIFERGLGLESLIHSHCSVLGCFKEDGAPTLLSQNMDLPNLYDGYQVLLHIKDWKSSVESYVFAVAGIMGLCGLNSQPIGICVNTVLDLNHVKGGLPVAFIVRRLLECSTLDEAMNFIMKIKHASGQNYMIADAERVVDFECSGNKVCEFEPYKGAHRLYHTNHALANDDQRASAAQVVEEKEPLTRSKARFSFLERELSDRSKSIDVKTIQSILTSHEVPVCIHDNRDANGVHTCGSVVMSLSSTPELQLAVQPPCSRGYETFRFS
ncbi:MAG: C45 family peptidase [Candidatus Bathyarchaeia archaeon]